MITEIAVDGFRSLINFRIGINKGLNVLVGPNGTGKSNFVSFLDFLSAFLDNDLNSAIAVAQGAGSVFSKERTEANEAKVNFRISGTWKSIPTDVPEWRRQDLSPEATYSYSCEVKYIYRIPAVFVAAEDLVIYPLGREVVKLTRKTSNQGSEFSTTIFVEISPQLRSNLLKYVRPDSGDASVEEFLRRRLAPEDSMLSFASYIVDDLASVMLDLTRYRSVNIDPAAARKPTPVGSGYQLLPSGEGLAGSLYQLKKGASYISRARSNRRFPTTPRRIKVNFDDIVSWCQEVNPQICSIDVRLNFSDAQLNPFMKFLNDGLVREYPFSRISDGTVKWLTIVTMLLSDADLNLVEEPENFLHPFMQELFVSLCRNVLSGDNERCLIVSTHSPSLLDCCEPTELKLFRLEAGQTRAVEVENWEELRAKIKNSRFGLGHYYRTGALYGTDSGPR